MSAKNGKVINLSEKRALRSTFDDLHTPVTKAIIYAGALTEFKRLVSPVIRQLLEIKHAPEPFQRELISLLEKVYAAQHSDPEQAAALAVPLPHKVNQK